MSLPKSIGDKVPGAGTADKGNKMPSPVLRTKEVVPVYAPGDSSHFGPGWQGDVSVDGLQQPIRSKQQSQLGPNSHTDASASHIGNPKPTTHISSRPSKMPARSSSSSSVSSADEDDLLPGVGPIRHPASSVLPPNSSPASLHTHDIVYLSTRAPATPSRFSTLRQSCVRTLSCELLPTHTGPILFGDPLAGYTIAYVFRLADPKARGGRRSYALLCICPDERIIVRSWKYVVRTFEWLVQRINSFAAVKNAHDKTAAAAAAVAKSNLGSTTSPIIGGTGMTGRFGGVTAPEGFLRRREGVGSAKGLAELVGKEDLFLQIHACFAELLGGLGRKFGYWNVVEPQVVLPIKSEKPIGAVGEEEHNWDRSRSVARMGGATGPGRDPKNLLIGNKGGGNGGVTVIQRSHSTDGSLSRGIDVKPLAVGGMA